MALLYKCCLKRSRSDSELIALNRCGGVLMDCNGSVTAVAGSLVDAKSLDTSDFKQIVCKSSESLNELAAPMKFTRRARSVALYISFTPRIDKLSIFETVDVAKYFSNLKKLTSRIELLQAGKLNQVKVS